MNQIAVALRTILEEYLKFKFPLRWVEGQDWFGTMIGEIREAEGDDPIVSCQDLVTDLTEVNDYCSRFHHRSNGMTADVTDARELMGYTEQALGIIHH